MCRQCFANNTTPDGLANLAVGVHPSGHAEACRPPELWKWISETQITKPGMKNFRHDLHLQVEDPSVTLESLRVRFGLADTVLGDKQANLSCA